MSRQSDKGGQVDYREEISLLRQKFGSMVMRGQYKECFKLIEDNLKLLYFKERWPENFLASLQFHKRCYAANEISTHYDEYLPALLKKNGIPAVIAKFLKATQKITWSVDSFRDMAVEAQTAGELEDALGYSELMIKMDQLSSSGYLLRGWILRDLARPPEAIESFERALELNKTNYQAKCALAEMYAATNFGKAVDMIDGAIEQLPGEAALYAVKARIYLAGGKKEEAMAAYDQANDLDPLNADYIFQKAEVILSEKGQELAAIRQYAKVLTVNEGHIPTLTRLGQLLADTQPEAALTHITKVVEAQPEDLSSNMLKARLLDKKGETQPAIVAYQRVLELDETVAQAQGALGRLHMPDQYTTALGYFEKASELDANAAEYLIGQGDCHRGLGHNDKAIAAYKKAITLDKRADKAYYALGSLVTDSDPKAALEYLTKAISLSPENAYYYSAKGELLLKIPKEQEAMDCFDKAVQFDPGNASLRYTLGALLEKSGKPTSAIEHYKSAVGLDPMMEGGYHGLARLLWEKEPENALLYINNALGMNGGVAEYHYLKSLCYIQLGKKSPDFIRDLRQSIPDERKNLDTREELAKIWNGEAPRAALIYIDNALEKDPRNPNYICVRADLMEAIGRRIKAVELFGRAAELDPSCHKAWYGLGRITAENENEDKKAIEYLEKAIALAPDNSRYLAEKASVVARDPFRYTEALACYDLALSKDNQMTDVVLAKARLLEEHGEFFEAVAQNKRALLIDRNCLEATAKLGVLLADINPTPALVYLDKALELEPGNYIHHIWRARALHALGDEVGAEAAVQAALKLGGEEVAARELSLGGATDQLYFMLANILYSRLPEISLKYCLKAIELAPDKAAYHLLRGNIHRRQGEDEHAGVCFAKALDLDPKCHEALARLAEQQYKREDAESLRLIEEAIAINGGNATYYYLKGMILDELCENRTQDAIGCLDEAIKLAPTQLSYHEKHLDLVKKSGARFAHFFEKRKVDKLRRKLEQAQAQAAAEQ
ncbi:MAG: tetratricopeptide repeat protein [Oscillospiraceae bacterium]|nr:tetratricopeptide repeat protein [Oscillospiraceae bacterium]